MSDEPKFKIGDRVRVYNTQNKLQREGIGIVTANRKWRPENVSRKGHSVGPFAVPNEPPTYWATSVEWADKKYKNEYWQDFVELFKEPSPIEVGNEEYNETMQAMEILEGMS
jgi:hypothetical protein